MRLFFIALQFLTRLPVPTTGEISRLDLARSTVCYPLVGALIGGLLVGVDWLARLVWPVEVASAAVIVAAILVTGGLHLDGLMDTCDGVFGLHARERRLEIMRDSRVGAFGVLGAVCGLLLKFSFLLALTGDLRWRALLLMPILSRWMMVFAVAWFPYARAEGGLGQSFADHTRPSHWLLASLPALLAAFLLFPSTPASLVLLGVWLVGVLTSLFLHFRLGGLTGDTYGAVNEIAELAVLAVGTASFPGVPFGSP